MYRLTNDNMKQTKKQIETFVYHMAKELCYEVCDNEIN